MDIRKISIKDIEKMDYNQMIGLTKETNRPPGGRKTVFEIFNRSGIDSQSKVLEIGTSTGFTAIELSKLVRCKIVSIDINEMSLKEAESRAKDEGLKNISFFKADVNKLPFANEEFDLIIIGNVLSLMSDRENALKECIRVCKKTGFLAAIPMFYLEKPSNKLVKDVSEAINVNITPFYKKDWINFFDIPELETYFIEDYKFDFIEDKKIKKFVEKILGRQHLKNLEGDVLKVLSDKYTKHIYLFRENLSHMGFSIILLSNKRTWEDPELFTSHKIK